MAGPVRRPADPRGSGAPEPAVRAERAAREDDEPQPPVDEEDLPGDIPVVARWGAGALAAVAGVVGAVAVFRTENGVGAAALLLVAVFLTMTAVDGRFPRLRIGDNEVVSNLRRAVRQTKGTAEQAKHRADDATYNSTEVMEGLAAARDGLQDAEARIAALERRVGARPEADTPSTGPSSGTPDVAFDLPLTPSSDDDRAARHPRPGAGAGQGAGEQALPDDLRELAERYKTVRWTMPRGADRTRAMEDLAREIVRAASASTVDVTPLLGSDDLGLRLVAACSLYARPDPAAAARVAEQALSDRKPFNEYWSLQALRRCLAGRCASLTPDLRRRLDARAEAIGRGTDRGRVIDGILRDCP
ncbi:hypothetical protein GXP71_13850 [Cellulomonas sp. H30R-01]|uniref:hypothetical protein n=1 Tax=Cellulomonas sp. H30R-01 TaxID=2704467 RepID=UPI00138DB3C7|nr:hypothetical protein [Cellulomonas sp. H30R-01]QHT57057.1 hypothetical protein GXP71_13850 [Cellulomonas sp. H30R-01]